MSEEILLPPVLSEQQLRSLVREAIELRRHALVFQAAEIWMQVLEGVPPPEPRDPQIEWLPIGSLSQLRAVVGVRFQKLRERWIAAGFPLREHRGDKPIRPEIDSKAWSDFVAWLQEEGFHARRSEVTDGVFFEIARRPREHNGR